MKNRRVFELRLGKVGLILFISGMSLLLFSLFLLGIVIGKQMEAYPERYASGIPELIRENLFAAVSKQGKGAAPAVSQGKNEDLAAGGGDFGLTFYDTLGGKKGGTAAGIQSGSKHKTSEIPVEQGVPAGTPAEASAPATASGVLKRETVSPAFGGEAGEKKMNPPAEGTSAGEKGTQRSPAGETALSGKGRFEVQVAAYRERPQADQLVKKFKALGFSPRVVMKELPGKGRWFRVIVDGFESRETAQVAADRMTGKVGGLKFVIRSSVREGNGG